MNKLIYRSIITVSRVMVLLVTATPAMASSPDIDRMSNREVTEYAIKMSRLIDEISRRELCDKQDHACLREEFSRHGVQYDDREALNKRLHLMIGSF